MPRYTPKHRAPGNPIRDGFATGSRTAITAAVAIPLASSAVVAAPAFASSDTAAPQNDGRFASLIRPDSSTALAPAYADLRSMLPGIDLDADPSAFESDLEIRDGLELEPRSTRPSRSGLRDAAGPEPVNVKVEDKRWARDDVNLRLGPGKRYNVIGDLEFRDGFGITGLSSGKWLQVKREGRSMWVHRGFVAKNRPPKPEPVVAETATSSTSSAAPAASGVCSNGTYVSGGANVLAVHNAICAAFPSITSYGTYRADSSNHASGRAIDAMVSGDLGYQVAEFVRANAGSLGVSEVIYAQRIWTVERAGEGWRYMEDRGSSTANHFDHVHVSTY